MITLEIMLLMGYLGLINLITFIMFGLDKSKAKRGVNRISEKTLLGISLIGGAFGGLLGMLVFRHKTKKLSFKLLFGIVLLINVIVYYFILKDTVIYIIEGVII